jgi:hypothetical protein
MGAGDAAQRPARPGTAKSRKRCAGHPAAEARPKTKKQERLERAIEVRAFALKLLGKHGRWTTLPNGPEVLRFEDAHFLLILYVREQVPREFRERFHLGPLEHGLYNLDLWNLLGKPRGKVLNLNWLTVSALPRIVTFRRGDWEQRLLQRDRDPCRE